MKNVSRCEIGPPLEIFETPMQVIRLPKGFFVPIPSNIPLSSFEEWLCM